MLPGAKKIPNKRKRFCCGRTFGELRHRDSSRKMFFFPQWNSEHFYPERMRRERRPFVHVGLILFSFSQFLIIYSLSWWCRFHVILILVKSVIFVKAYAPIRVPDWYNALLPLVVFFMFLYRYASTYVVLFSFLVPPTSQTYPFGSLPSCWGVILFFVFVFLAGFSLFARFLAISQFVKPYARTLLILVYQLISILHVSLDFFFFL